MSKNASALKVKLSSYDELFGAANAPATSDKNQIVNVALGELHTFQNHPFKVNDDKEMEELAESIREHGINTPCSRILSASSSISLSSLTLKG